MRGGRGVPKKTGGGRPVWAPLPQDHVTDTNYRTVANRQGFFPVGQAPVQVVPPGEHVPRLKSPGAREFAKQALGRSAYNLVTTGHTSDLPGAGLELGMALLPFGKIGKAGKAIVAGEDAAKVAGPVAKPAVEKTGEDVAARVARQAAKAKPIRAKQDALYAAERSKRIAEAERLMNEVGGEEGHRLALKALSGDLPKLEFSGFKEFDRSTVPALLDHIQQSTLRPFEKVRTRTAILRVFDGKVPTRGEIKLIETVFGKDDAAKLAGSASLWRKAGNIGLQLLNVPRALKSSFDISAPFRQGLVLGARHPKMFASEFKPMLKALGSENAYTSIMDDIVTRPTYKAMQEAKLSLTDLENISTREEAYASNLAEHLNLRELPGLHGKKFATGPGDAVRASGRAYVGYLNKFRADAFDNYLELAASPHLELHFVKGVPVIKKVVRDVHSDEKLLRDIANWVNTATGRGSIKHFESAMVPLQAALFSPRLIASRLQLLNPVYYAKLDPFARTQAVRGMAQLLGAISLTLWTAKMAGAKVGLNPRSADFGKIKVGNTRVDLMGGFQQYLVAAGRFITGEKVSSTTGETVHLTGGWGQQSRGTVLQDLVTQKLAPVPGYAWGWMNNQNQAGKPFDPVKEAGLLVAPLGPEGAFETYRSSGPGPALSALLLGSVGFGVQTYGPKKSVNPMSGSTSGGTRPGGSSRPAWAGSTKTVRPSVHPVGRPVWAGK